MAEIASIFNHTGTTRSTSLDVLTRSGAAHHIRSLSGTVKWSQDEIDSAFIITLSLGYRETLKALRDIGARLPSIEQVIDSNTHLG